MAWCTSGDPTERALLTAARLPAAGHRATGALWQGSEVNGPDALAEWMAIVGVPRGGLVGLAVAGDHVGIAAPGEAPRSFTGDVAALVARADATVRPRWVVWSQDTASALIAGGTRIASRRQARVSGTSIPVARSNDFT